MPSAIDGDTLDIRGTCIRLYGIDMPESAQSCEMEDRSYRCGQGAALACAELIGSGFALGYVDLWSAGERPAAPTTPGGTAAGRAARTRKAKAASKTRFARPSCAANAWATGSASISGCGVLSPAQIT